MTGTIMTATSKKEETKMKKKEKKFKKLKLYRIKAGYTVYALADVLGVSPSSVSYWESGKKFPRPSKMMQLENMFNTGYRELFEDMSEEELEELKQFTSTK